MIASIPEPDSSSESVIAAVDLGSNSFHMVVARERHGQIEIIDRLREMVRLASGLTGDGFLDKDSQDRALACLGRFGQRLRDVKAHRVRVVGTNTLRRARNSDVFLDAAESALGHPVEVISGIEEARLIYQGVSHHVESAEGLDFVVDIGGGSTELIVGSGTEPSRLESVWLGCVGFSRRFFDNGRITAKRMAKARLAASLELVPVVATFRRTGWTRAIGSSGTIRAARRITHELGLGETITIAALDRIIAEMVAAGHADEFTLPGLSADRAPVLPGGIAILVEVLCQFGIDNMQVSDGALREGLLIDIVGRLHHQDARERSILAMQAKFHVDADQAQRVEATASLLAAAVAESWKLDDGTCMHLIQWAARLHEVGLDIAHSKYHQHGAYLLANADMPGFTRLEQQLLATVVGNHRRKLEMVSIDTLPDDWRAPVFRLIVIFRIAVLLHRSRSPDSEPLIRLKASEQKLVVTIDKGWIGKHPLTHADLQQEQQFLALAGFELVVRTGQVVSRPQPDS